MSGRSARASQLGQGGRFVAEQADGAVTVLQTVGDTPGAAAPGGESRLAGREAALHVGFHGFHHHNGVINNKASGNGQRH